MNEFESYAARQEFWENLSDEMQALMKEHIEKACIIDGSLEHYYYGEYE